MAKIRYRLPNSWRRLVNYLNERHSISEKRIEKYLCNRCHNYDMKRHLRILIMLRFCERKFCVNQNNKITVKIVMKRRIPKKLTEELANEMLQKPWLAWFMFPE